MTCSRSRRRRSARIRLGRSPSSLRHWRSADMASDVERQIADYFGWVEREAGVSLSAVTVVGDDEATTIAALERQLTAPAARRAHPRRHLALAAAGTLIVAGTAIV